MKSLLLYSSLLDLRQDMLTLQMIQLMENLWKKEGLDLRYSGKSSLQQQWLLSQTNLMLFISLHALTG